MQNVNGSKSVQFIGSVDEGQQPLNERQQSGIAAVSNRSVRKEPGENQHTPLIPLGLHSHCGWTENTSINNRSLVVLPNEILGKIFSYLSFDDLRACKRATQRFYQIIGTNNSMEAVAFYRSRHLLDDSGKRLWNKQSWPEIRNWLENCSDKEKEAVRRLEKQTEHRQFPEIVFFSMAKALTGAEFFEAHTIATISYREWVKAVRFSPDGSYLATVTRGKIARINELVDGVWQVKATIRDSHELRMDVIFSPDSNHFVAVFYDAIKIYSLVDGLWQEKNRVSNNVYSGTVSFSSDSKQLLACHRDRGGGVNIWSFVDRQWQKEDCFQHVDFMCRACFSSNGHRILTVGAHAVKIHRSVDGTWQKEMDIPSKRPTPSDGAFSPDGCHVAIIYRDATMAQIYGLVNRQWLKKSTTDLFGYPSTVNFSPDGNHVLFGGAGVQIYKFVGGYLHKQTVFQPSAWKARFSPDGNHFLIADLEKDGCRNRVIIYGVFNGEWREKATLLHYQNVLDANFRPDSCHIVTGSLDNTARIWRLQVK